MIQTEAERQFYLSMAGVHLWYARDALPGAAASPDYVFPETEGDSGYVNPDAGRSVASAPRNLTQSPPLAGGNKTKGAPRPDLRALMGESPKVSQGNEPEPVDVSPEVVPAQKIIDGESVSASGLVVPDSPPVSVQVWLGRRVAVIARISPEVSEPLQSSLVVNILRSLGETEPRTQGTVHWPVFNNRLVPGNSLADFGSVLGYVLSELGDQVLVNLGVDNDIVRSAFETAQVQPGSQRIDFPHTLAEMAATPSLKRELWLRIKPIAAGQE